MTAGQSASEIVTLIRKFRFHFADEVQLQDGLELVLRGATRGVEREAQLDGASRIDFLVGDVGVEVKVDGPLSAVTTQLHRYAQHPRVQALVLVTTRQRHNRLPEELNGKPVRVVVIGAFA